MYSTCDYPWYIISLGRIPTNDLVYGGCIFQCPDAIVTCEDLERIIATKPAGWSRPQKWWRNVKGNGLQKFSRNIQGLGIEVANKNCPEISSTKTMGFFPKMCFFQRKTKTKQLQPPISDQKSVGRFGDGTLDG